MVHSRDNLREKARIFQMEYDDRIVEMFKVWGLEYLRDNGVEDEIERILCWVDDDGSLEITFFCKCEKGKDETDAYVLVMSEDQYIEAEEDLLDYLEELYCSPDTYDMVSRMLYDGDEVLRRKLARFDEDHYEIKNTTFSKKLCLDVFNALILNELKYNIDEALEERYESEDDKRARALFYDCDLEMTYSPILVYNRRTNEIQMDETNLSDVFLIPVCNFYWAQINLIDAINLYTNCFGDEILAKFIYPTLEKENLSVSDVKSAAFCTPWFLSMENALMEGFSIKRNDYKLLEVRENIARKWLTYQNEKSLR
jgi:hypothetical protein